MLRRHVFTPLAALFVLLAAACGHSTADAARTDAADSVSVPLYGDLGSHAYPITTSSEATQQYFDQGLRLYYAFNHAESIRAFEQAARLEPECAMCYWGIALAHGPNINAPMDPESGVAAYQAVQRAMEHIDNASPREQALIRALATRYAAEPPEQRASLDSAYARAMGDVVRQFPTDLEAATLHAESLMDLSPWHYWTREGEPRPQTREILSTLERVIAENPNHPGACHFYIHAVEEVHPERAVSCAERLADLMPGAGHLVHMPGHIYIRVGRYMDAIRANEHAVHADETYIRDQRPGVGIYTAGYYPHNYDFMAFAAAMAGRSRQAIEAADRVASLVPDEMLRAPGMTMLQNFAMRPLQMQVRFGRWEQILRAPEPAADLPHARGIWHYARGRAFAARGDVPAAERELAEIRATIEDPATQGLSLEFNEVATVLGIAAEVLAGQIAAARNDYEPAIAHLREAARIEDSLIYGEPPEWSVPVRHDLGAVLLAAGRPEEAEAVFREDLARFPENGWSLVGLRQSLEARGQAADAEQVGRRYADAWRHADVQLTASRF